MSVPAADPSLFLIEKLTLSDNLNSTVLFTFLMGIYTMIYFGTLTLYLTKKSSQPRTVIFSITLLYFLDIIMLGMQWYALEWVFVANGETRESSFTSISSPPGWALLLATITSCYIVVIAYGLMALLCLVETILVGGHASHTLPSEVVVLVDTIQSALFFTSLSSSLLETLLIAFRIHSLSKQGGGLKRRFGHIIEILVQSAAVYSLALLILGIAGTLTSNSLAMGEFVNYGVAVAFTITGIAPTIMVARVCLAADTSTHARGLSGLQFQGRSTRQNATQIMVEDAPEMVVEVIFTDKVAAIV